MIRAMWRRPSALTAIGGFSVGIAVLSVAITAAVVALMPDPPAIRMTVGEAAAALRGGASTLERSVGEAPRGQAALLLQSALAEELGRPPSAVRVVWHDPPRGGGGTGGDGVVVLTTSSRGALRDLLPPGATPGRITIRRSEARPIRILPAPGSSGVIRGLLAALPQPAFIAAVQLRDGRWLRVAPPSPILGGWRLKVLAALAASLAVLAPLAWLFARRLTRPFRALATAIDEGRDPPQAEGPRELQDSARAILQLRTRLAAQSEERSRMLSAVAHDLRTPLTSLRLRIEGVAEPARTRMIADADRMQAMIADVLDFAHAADAPRAPVALRPLVAEVTSDHPAIDLADGPEVTVPGAEAALRRAVENLVRNAVDYAGGGRVEVAEAGGMAAIRVIDAGPGIPAEDRARLMLPFERGEASRNRDTGGVGLGLSIVQNIALLHGGRLTLDAAPGGGTIATLSLPSHPEPA